MGGSYAGGGKGHFGADAGVAKGRRWLCAWEQVGSGASELPVDIMLMGRGWVRSGSIQRSHLDLVIYQRDGDGWIGVYNEQK